MICNTNTIGVSIGQTLMSVTRKWKVGRGGGVGAAGAFWRVRPTCPSQLLKSAMSLLGFRGNRAFPGGREGVHGP